jgi:hypothetical protein
MARIRVFDPAYGSGNFLVIAYKEMRAIEVEINRRRGEGNLRTTIPLTNFRGIELRHFSAEIARLALVIAKFQCDVLYLGQQEARLLFLPLERDNWITCGNALRLDWLSVCPPTGTGVKLYANDLNCSSIFYRKRLCFVLAELQPQSQRPLKHLPGPQPINLYRLHTTPLWLHCYSFQFSHRKDWD